MSAKPTKPNRLLSLLANKQLFWLLGIAFLFVLSFWWIPGDSTNDADSYSTQEAGKYAYFQTMRSLHQDAEITRSVDQLIPDDAEVLVILSPVRNPSEEEWDELWRFVNSGGRLLFAPHAYTQDIQTGRFNVSINNSWVAPTDPFEPDKGPAVGIARTWEKQSIPWASTSDLDVERPGKVNQVLVMVGGRVQAVRRRMGAGSATFVASDFVFQNKAMFDPKLRQVASKLFELSRPYGRIYFDESLSSSGTPRVLGILFTPMFRPISLQLLLIAMVFGWWGSKRFGPAIMPKSTDRRAIVEHAQALGNLHFKIGTAGHALRSYFEYFRGVAQVPGGRIDKVAGVLAARSGIEQSEVERLLTETQKAIQAPNLASGTAATLIQQLANLRDRTMRVGDKPKA